MHRHELMRTHTTLHILYGTVFRDYGAKVTRWEDMSPLVVKAQLRRGKLVGKSVHGTVSITDKEPTARDA